MENLDKVYAKRIAEEYALKTTSKVVRLKKLDQKVKRPAEIFAYTFGVFAALILGAGMSIMLVDFKAANTVLLPFGIVLGLVGLVMCAFNYCIYKDIIKYRKAKYVSQINELANEIIIEK